MKYHASIKITFIMIMQHHGEAYDVRGKIECAQAVIASNF